MQIDKEVQRCAYQKLAYLEGMKHEGAQKAQLAKLRRGVGKEPGELPELWGLLFEDVPEELLGRNGREASPAEWALYQALTHYALHRQGSESTMQKKDVSLGKAAAQLCESKEDEERILRRFKPLVTAQSREELAGHLRGLVQLLSAKGIGLDYALLAKHLYLFQREETLESVRLTWGRDFYRELDKYKEKEGKDHE